MKEMGLLTETNDLIMFMIQRKVAIVIVDIYLYPTNSDLTSDVQSLWCATWTRRGLNDALSENHNQELITSPNSPTLCLRKLTLI